MPQHQFQAVTVLLLSSLAFAAAIATFGRAVGFASPWMAFPLMSCVLGLARVADPLLVLKVPSGIRRLRPWEVHLYRRLGVDTFGAVLRDTAARLLNPGVYLSPRDRDPRRVLRRVESAEASHFWAAMMSLPYLALAALGRQWAILISILAVDVVLNAYPIMHLRRVRARLDRAFGRLRA